MTKYHRFKTTSMRGKLIGVDDPRFSRFTLGLEISKTPVKISCGLELSRDEQPHSALRLITSPSAQILLDGLVYGISGVIQNRLVRLEGGLLHVVPEERAGESGISRVAFRHGMPRWQSVIQPGSMKRISEYVTIPAFLDSGKVARFQQGRNISAAIADALFMLQLGNTTDALSELLSIMTHLHIRENLA